MGDMKVGETTGVQEALERLGIAEVNSGAGWGEWVEQPRGGELVSINPSDGSEIAKVRMAGADDYEDVMRHAAETFPRWRAYPAPKRGEIVREIGDELRRHKDDLGVLVSLEMGKVLAEGLGEVQEMIDIADFAVGPLAPALRPDDAERAPGAPHV